MFKHTFGMHRLTASLKAAALIVVLGLVMVAIESPRFISGNGDATAKASATQTSQESTAQLPTSGFEYFPAQFPAPKGEVEPLPPQF
ncbi:MAG TPA: hypothetical protein VKG21_22625 [Casimicrobiaceae bacterium]|nr:hypothetical protein [Casimicrobiaceae bacterium]